MVDSKSQNEDFDRDCEDLCAEDDETDAIHAFEGRNTLLYSVQQINSFLDKTKGLR